MNTNYSMNIRATIGLATFLMTFLTKKYSFDNGTYSVVYRLILTISHYLVDNFSSCIGLINWIKFDNHNLLFIVQIVCMIVLTMANVGIRKVTIWNCVKKFLCFDHGRATIIITKPNS